MECIDDFLSDLIMNVCMEGMTCLNTAPLCALYVWISYIAENAGNPLYILHTEYTSA